MEEKVLLSTHQIWKMNKIYWIKTYKTLLKYVSKQYKDILQPISVGKKTGKRYFIKEERLNKFVEMFENGELSQDLQERKIEL